jgi:diadenosine tetraphosphatase ApaH/serine/threonine PP2A family protein phosphatase
MRYGVIADIHSNLEALEQVLPLLKSVDKFFCLGDIVGYGPNPTECIKLLKQTQNITVAGNHDLGAVEKISLYDFSFDAQEACEWTKRRLLDNDKNYLKSLALKERVGDDILLVHGSPRNPIWEYLLSVGDAEINFEKFDFQICFVGHTHIPAIFQRPASSDCEILEPEPGEKRQLDKKIRYIINVGSIGQPRDGDPRASFAIFDDETYTVEFFRVSYPVEETQKKMRKENLPSFLIDRLPFGM